MLLDRELFEQADRIVWRDLKHPDNTAPPALSRTALEQVQQERQALLCNDLEDSGPLRNAPSLMQAQTRSLLVVPLMLFDQMLGVFYFDTKENEETPFDENHLQLATAMAGMAAVAFDNLRRWERLEGETRRLQAEINRSHGLQHGHGLQFGMIGESAALRAVYQLIERVAPNDSTVLMRGESGTGKEVAARALHNLSARKNEPFIAVNCATLTESLLASQLFGHRRGAFTGAVNDQAGVFEAAHGGTLFLDEIGDVPLNVQTSLLRALQERVITRLGETKPRKVDVRIIAATNRPLEEAIKQGGFRSDLYYRLNVVALTMPPLRQRRDDIPLLAQYFIKRYSQSCKRAVAGLSPAARAVLLAYDWPGNVRELENAMERAVVLGTTEWILPEDLPEALLDIALPADITSDDYHAAVKHAKQQIVLRSLEQANGNFTAAAQRLGLHPNNLHRLVKDLGLRDSLKQ